ncbi:hypothetical protein CR513_12229, partial [Mucuna pruriens]
MKIKKKREQKEKEKVEKDKRKEKDKTKSWSEKISEKKSDRKESPKERSVKSKSDVLGEMLDNFKELFPKDISKGLPPIKGIEHHIDFTLGETLPNMVS